VCPSPPHAEVFTGPWAGRVLPTARTAPQRRCSFRCHHPAPTGDGHARDTSRSIAEQPGARAVRLAPDEAVRSDLDERVDVVEGWEPVGLLSFAGLRKGLVSALVQPGLVTRGIGLLARNLVAIDRASDAHLPSPKDKRFTDPAWSEHPVYRRIAQGYLALVEELEKLVAEYEQTAVDWHDVERARFAMAMLTSTGAPTNTLPGNPAALKRAFDTGGPSLARGLRQFAHDVRHNGGMPSQTDRSASSSGQTSRSCPERSSTGTTSPS
jgi:polyhydroxyalkanoate synthase subunit PhaC